MRTVAARIRKRSCDSPPRRHLGTHRRDRSCANGDDVVEEEDNRRNRRPAGQSALIRFGANEVVVRLAAGRHPAAGSAPRNAARHLSTRHCDQWTAPAGTHNIEAIIHQGMVQSAHSPAPPLVRGFLLSRGLDGCSRPNHARSRGSPRDAARGFLPCAAPHSRQQHGALSS
jgi:hypothetical protein